MIEKKIILLALLLPMSLGAVGVGFPLFGYRVPDQFCVPLPGRVCVSTTTVYTGVAELFCSLTPIGSCSRAIALSIPLGPICYRSKIKAASSWQWLGNRDTVVYNEWSVSIPQLAWLAGGVYAKSCWLKEPIACLTGKKFVAGLACLSAGQTGDGLKCVGSALVASAGVYFVWNSLFGARKDESYEARLLRMGLTTALPFAFWKLGMASK